MLVISREIEKDMVDAMQVSKQLQFEGRIDQHSTLESNLGYLMIYACVDADDPERYNHCRVFVSRDFAPHSFSLTWFVKAKEGEGLTAQDYPARDYPELVGYTYWINGGLILHGNHDNGGDGGAPTLSMNLTPVSGWSIHT